VVNAMAQLDEMEDGLNSDCCCCKSGFRAPVTVLALTWLAPVTTMVLLLSTACVAIARRPTGLPRTALGLKTTGGCLNSLAGTPHTCIS
jgi:hypothetical protein